MHVLDETTRRLRLPTAGAVALATWVVVVSCGPGDTVEITGRRVVAAGSDPVLPGATSDQRFGRSRPTADHDHDHDHEDEHGPTVVWEVPEDWEVLPASGIAMASFRPAGRPDTQCTVTVLGGTGGGLAANVNRWRDQLGLEPLDERAVANLPRVPVLGAMATVVEMHGSPGTDGDDSSALMGLIVPVEGMTLFVKMTGPSDAIVAEQQAFEAFCHSLRLQRAQDERSTTTGASRSLRYSLPAGWRDAGSHDMREVDLRAGDETECYVVLLSGEAGGLLPNRNRWRHEVGLEPIGEEEARALDRIALLGEPCPLLEVSEGAPVAQDASASRRSVLGTLLIRPTRSVFVKMVGPRAEVSAHKEAFLAFCASLQEVR